MGLLDRLRDPLERRVKQALSSDDLDALVARRDRRRVRWLAETAADPVLRFRAIRALAEFPDADGVELFTGLLAVPPGDVEPAFVRVSADGLGRLRHAASSNALKKLLLPDRPVHVALAAARALARIGDRDDWAAIRAWALSGHGEADGGLPDVRDHAEPLSGARGIATVARVLQPLFADKDATWRATKARGVVDGPDAAPRIGSDEGADKVVAQRIRFSFDRKERDDDTMRADLLRLADLALARDWELLTGILGKDESNRAAVQAIGLHGDPRSVSILAAREAADVDAARDLARAIGRLGWPGGEGRLETLRTQHPGAAVEVASALGEIGSEAAVRLLLDDLRRRADREDPAADELAAVAGALRRCGSRGREAVRGARTLAKSTGERRRMDALALAMGLS